MTPAWVIRGAGLSYAARGVATVVGLEMVFRAVASKEETRRIAALKSIAIIHSLIVAPLSLYALITHPDLRAQTLQVLRFEDVSELFDGGGGREWADLLTSFTVGFFVFELFHARDWAPSTRVDKLTMIVHHVVSAVLWPLSIRLEIAYFFLVHFELTEVSSPFLQLRWFAKTYGNATLEAVVSLVFALVFFAFRTTVVVPMFRAIYLTRPWDGALYPRLSLAVRIISLVSLYIPFLLNSLWSWQIVKMGLRIYNGKKHKKTQQRAAKID
ncbi:hypothetical protein CTAYLR_000003 [Chrysophaeum taylorii]|uniref:TLC domain-containing protein n=1 Tax=Chrysophaeum taylorii TaxID=2483200 RepID=A0AAD7UIZ0_9STRA|nr:hypothetical protein CTAYLR_000003 [Chrysophaeum taylorii]